MKENAANALNIKKINKKCKTFVAGAGNEIELYICIRFKQLTGQGFEQKMDFLIKTSFCQ